MNGWIKPRALRRSVRTSIHTRLTVFCLLFLSLLAAAVAFTVVQSSEAGKFAERLRTQTFPAIRVLADMDAELTVARHARLMEGHESGDAARAQADAVLRASRSRLRELLAQYLALPVSTRERKGAEVLGRALDIFFTAPAGEAREATDRGQPSGATGVPSREGGREAARRALADLTTIQQESFSSAVGSAEHRSEVTIGVAFILSLLSLFLADWIVVRIRGDVTEPLEKITQSLSRLAGGGLDHAVAETDREDEIGALARAFEVFRRNVQDLQAAHGATEAAQRRADELARYDPLTGLANRRVFLDDLRTAIAGMSDGAAPFAVFVLDLDRFKPVNDVHGHAAGDQVLCEVAERLRLCVGANGLVARLGGDEFGALVRPAGPAGEITDGLIRLADRILSAVAEPILVDGKAFEVGISIGVSVCPLDSDDPEALIQNADLAMYRAKRDGRATFQFFEAEMEREVKARAALEADLRRAVASEEIKPYYQPIVALADQQVVGFEILARWEHPDGRILQPDAFVRIAEETGLITEMTSMLLRRACHDSAEWPEHVGLSLNVSPVQLKDTRLPTRLLAVLSAAGFPPHRLEIEITETALVDDLAMARSILSQLRSLGIRVALDDFGTGYSSLCHLRDFSLDRIKIDRSFVQTLMQNPDSEKIITAILGLGTSLGLPTTAEGIEDLDTVRRMAASGCELGQGFYFAEAMPAAEARAYAERAASLHRSRREAVRGAMAPGS